MRVCVCVRTIAIHVSKPPLCILEFNHESVEAQHGGACAEQQVGHLVDPSARRTAWRFIDHDMPIIDHGRQEVKRDGADLSDAVQRALAVVAATTLGHNSRIINAAR